MAIPAILQQLGKASPAVSQLKQMMSAIRMAKDPQAMMQQMMMNNPQMQNVMKIVNQYGGDPMKAFYEEAKARGVDPEEIIGMLK